MFDTAPMIGAMISARARLRERELADCLGRWVSELPPTQIISDTGVLIGIGLDGDPKGTVTVYASPLARALHAGTAP